MNNKKFILMLSCLTAAFCVLIVVYNFASMPPYGTEAVSAVALYKSSSQVAGDLQECSSETGSAEISSCASGTASKSKASSSKANKKSTKTSSKAASSAANDDTDDITGTTLYSSAAQAKNSASSSKATPQSPVNINTASLAELDSIPYIGPTKAQAILDYRNQNGNFTSVDGLENIKGIKAGTVNKIRQYVTV